MSLTIFEIRLISPMQTQKIVFHLEAIYNLNKLFKSTWKKVPFQLELT